MLAARQCLSQLPFEGPYLCAWVVGIYRWFVDSTWGFSALAACTFVIVLMKFERSKAYKSQNARQALNVHTV